MLASTLSYPWRLPATVLPVLGNESIHFNINYSELEELLPVATFEKNGLMNKDIFRGIMYTSMKTGTDDTKTYILIKGEYKFSAIISASRNGSEIELFYIGDTVNHGRYAKRISGSSSFSRIYGHKTEKWFLISGLGIWAPVGILCFTGELIELTPVDSSEFSLSDYNQLL